MKQTIEIKKHIHQLIEDAVSCNLYFVVFPQNSQSIPKKIQLQSKIKRKLDVSEDELTQMKQYVENNLKQYVVVVDLKTILPLK